MDNLTVVVSSYRRAKFLDRALASARAAGIRRIVVSASEPGPDVQAVLEKQRAGWLSFEVVTHAKDPGSNQAWVAGFQRAQTTRVQWLADDDLLAPTYGKTYAEIISPVLDAGGVFASWEAHFYYENGTTGFSNYWSGPTRVLASSELLKVVGTRRRLSLSPVLGVFDRKTLIGAYQEAFRTLTTPESYTRPGMLIGDDLLVWYRHLQKFPKWLYVNQVLSYYGHHADSETVHCHEAGIMDRLCRAYDLARDQAEDRLPVGTTIRHVYSQFNDPDEDTARRLAFAKVTWESEYRAGGCWQAVPVTEARLSRDARSQLGDPRPVPFIRDMIELAVKDAQENDVVFLSNSDICFVPGLTKKILDRVTRGGCAYVYRWDFDGPLKVPIADEASVKRGTWYLGNDAFVFTVKWWNLHGSKFPDMVLGRCSWDTAMRALMKLTGGVKIPEAIYHERHRAFWSHAEGTGPGGRGSRWRTIAGSLHNYYLALKFFREHRCGGNEWRTAEDYPGARNREFPGPNLAQIQAINSRIPKVHAANRTLWRRMVKRRPGAWVPASHSGLAVR